MSPPSYIIRASTWRDQRKNSKTTHELHRSCLFVSKHDSYLRDLCIHRGARKFGPCVRTFVYLGPGPFAESPFVFEREKSPSRSRSSTVTAVFLLLSATTTRYDEEIVIRFRNGRCTFDATGRDDRNLIRIIRYINLENGDERTNHFEERDLQGAVFGDFSVIRLHRCHSNFSVSYSSQCRESQCCSNRRHSPLQVYPRVESQFYHIRKIHQTFSQSVNLRSYATVCTCHRVLHHLNYIAREIFFDEGNYLIN